MPLPTYPFQRQRYWIEPQFTAVQAPQAANPLARSSGIQDWFYLPVWQQTPPPALRRVEHPLLVFVDDGLGAELADHLEQRQRRVIRVERGTLFARQGRDRYSIRPDDLADYGLLLAAVQAVSPRLDGVVYTWGMPPAAGEDDALEGFTSLAWLLQTLAASEPAGPIIVLTEQVQDVLGTECCDPLRAAVLGLSLVAPHEHRELVCRAIDLVRPAPGVAGALLDLLQAEIESEATDPFVAFRGTRRFVPGFAPSPLREGEAQRWPLRSHGVYMITEARSALGVLLAEHLAETVQARLILITDPQSETGIDDQRLIQMLQKHGAEVLICPAAIESPEALAAAVAAGVAAFGSLNGIIHLAHTGIEANARQTIAELRPADVQRLLRQSAGQVAALAQEARNHALDFCLIFSSTAAVFGGASCAIPAAVSRVLESAASRQPGRWISAALDPWTAETTRDPHLGALFGRFAVNPAEGKAVLRRAVTAAPPGVLLVSAADPQARQQLAGQPVAEEGTAQGAGALELADPRLQLDTPYVEPRNATEQMVADIWQEILGLERVGIHDNFFELGGHSLIATQLISRLRHAFLVDVPHEELIVAPTVAELAETIAALILTQDQEKLDILQMLAELSEEEVEQELSQRRALVDD